MLHTKFESRWYQIEAADALLKSIVEKPEVSPVIVIPTAGGKTIIIAKVIFDYLEMSINRGKKVLVISHTEDIVRQDHAAISEFFTGLKIGLWSAGLKSRDLRKITVGSIQSLHRHIDKIKDYDLVIIDEAHSVAHTGRGMYRKLIKGLKDTAVVCGVTATPFRTGSGYIHKGEGALFTDIVYDLSSMENFNRLIDEGYLAPLIGKQTNSTMDVSNVGTRMGDFVSKDLSTELDTKDVTELAVNETIEYGKNYKKWLIFAIDIDHANNIAFSLISKGIPTGVLHTQIAGDKTEIKKKFNSGEYRALVSVAMITTGFDEPSVDLIATMRPTQSPVLHVQMLGRGMRIFEGKKHCLVLDFAGNLERLGPINDVHIPEPRKKGERVPERVKPRIKECPQCMVMLNSSVTVCNVCGYEYPPKEEVLAEISGTASFAEVIKRARDHFEKEVKAKVELLKVQSVEYYYHRSVGKVPSMRVQYTMIKDDKPAGKVTEWVCLDHSNKWIKIKSKNWIRSRLPMTMSMPKNISELIKISDSLKSPTQLVVDRSEEFDNIIEHLFL